MEMALRCFGPRKIETDEKGSLFAKKFPLVTKGVTTLR